MKKKIVTPYLLLLITLISSTLYAQEQLELLYLKGEHAKILEETTNKNDSLALFWRAATLDKIGNTKEAIETLEFARTIQTGCNSCNKHLGGLYYRTGQYALAKPLLVAHQDEHENFIRLIKILEFESDYTSAIELIEHRIDSVGDNLELLYHLGENYEEEERFLSANTIFLKIISINPHDILAHAKAANLKLKLRDFQGAIELCNAGLKQDTMNQTLIRIRGLAAFRKADFDLATADFSTLLARGDSSISTLKHLGISESKLYDFHASRRHLLLAREVDSLDHELCFFLGRAYLNSTEPEKGIYYLDLANELLEPDPGLLAAICLEKVSVYTTLNRYDLAMEQYQMAYAHKAKPEYLFFMASLLQYHLNDKKEAFDYYQRFLDALPPKEESQNLNQSELRTVSLKKAAEENIEKLKEELFFEGEMGN